ncbi:porin [Caballeronia sp. S22]|uniref:porin n=1 Tax=Caballeronia sp. S22 TaxID=3137182 RepID=UPI0035306E5A
MNHRRNGGRSLFTRARSKYPSRARMLSRLLTGILATAPVAAAAQSSVTLYGLIDTGINYRTSAGITSSGKPGSALVLASGNDFTSRWGLLGYEELGGGMKAIFQLENGFSAVTGAGNFSVPFPNDTNSLFDRMAIVGIKSPLGTVRLGRNYSPFYEGVVAGDTAISNFGSMSLVVMSNSSNVNPKLGPAGEISGINSRVNGGLMYAWVNNSVKYTIPDNTYGFSGSALYSFGGTAGSIQNKSTWSANLDWTNGTLGLISGYFDAKDPSGLTNNPWLRAYALGITYVFGSVKTGFEFSKFRNPTTGANQNFYYVSTSWQTTPFLSFVADYTHLQDLQNSSAGSNVYRVGTTYFLSKSSSIYADIGYADNKSQGVLPGGEGATPLLTPGLIGRNQLAIAAGIRKLF